MIKLFNSTDTDFSTLGLGNLTDATACVVTEERNGTFELELEYPIDGIHYSDIALRSIIVCKSNPYSNEQAFRVYYISKPISGLVTIYAEHISYDLSGMVVSPFEAENASAAFIGMKNNSIPTCDFNFSTDKEVQAKFRVTTPSSLRSLLGGVEGSILDIYGTGEYEFDNYSVSFKTHRGMDRGVTIRYGKNLTDLTQEENCTKVYTAIYPFWVGTRYTDDVSEDVLITLPEKIVNVEGTFNFTRIMPLDLGEYFEEAPSEEQLRNITQRYIENNDIGKPDVSLKVSFIQLEQAEEYELLKLLETVYLCDTVTVIFPELGVNSTAKCITTEYDAITNKYISLELGSTRTNLANTIVNQSAEIANAPTASFMEQEITRATKVITGGLGGYVILHSSSGQKQPDELLFLDENSGGDYRKSTNIWRFNKDGFGFSSTGYNGPYKNIALTKDGVVLADQVKAEGIQAGTIEAIISIVSPSITGGTIEGSTIVSKANDSKGRLNQVQITGGHLRILNTDDDFLEITQSGSSKWGSGTFALGGANCAGYDGGHYYGNDDTPCPPWGICKAGWQASSGSDRRLKNTIEGISEDYAVNLIDNLRPVSFKYNNNDKITHFGLIAQEVREVLDDICGDDRTLFLEYQNGEYRTVEYQELITPIIAYIQKLRNEIKELREEIK